MDDGECEAADDGDDVGEFDATLDGDDVGEADDDEVKLGVTSIEGDA